MERIPVEEAKENFDDLIKLVSNGKQRFIVRDGKGDRAAFLPAEDLALLQAMSDDAKSDAIRVEVSTIRGEFDARIEAMSASSAPIVLVQNGKEVGALVPPRDLHRLETLDGEIDMEAAKRLLDKQMGQDWGGSSG